MARGDQDLVPRNLPYGGRQAYIDTARQAGVPIASRPLPPGGPPQAAPPRGAAPGGEELITPDMDVFSYASPDETLNPDMSLEGRTAQLESEMAYLAQASPNPLVRALAVAFLKRRREPTGESL